jgi:hypothetical protein
MIKCMMALATALAARAIAQNTTTNMEILREKTKMNRGNTCGGRR